MRASMCREMRVVVGKFLPVRVRFLKRGDGCAMLGLTEPSETQAIAFVRAN